jgi:hypothetical protein
MNGWSTKPVDRAGTWLALSAADVVSPQGLERVQLCEVESPQVGGEHGALR